MANILRELKIELTQECPLACVHCSTNSSRKQHSALPRDVVLRLLKDAPRLGTERVVFTGGEPLVYPFLSEAIQVAHNEGLHSTLYTTGIVDNALSPLSPNHALKLRLDGVSRFIFSVYSHVATVHDSVTRYGTHSATLTAVRNALASTVPVEIHFVAMRRNYRDLAGVVRLAEDLGIRRVSVLRFVPQGRGRNIVTSDDLEAYQLQELADSISSLRKQFSGIEIRTGSPFNILAIGHTPCNAADDVLVINHRGDVFPCDAFKNVRFPEPLYGSILNRSLKEVWTRSEFLNTVREIVKAEKPEPCNSCIVASTCQSGCLAQKVIRSGWGAVANRDPGCLISNEDRSRKGSAPESPLVQITVS